MTQPYMVLGVDAGRTSGVALVMMGVDGPELLWSDSGRSSWEMRDEAVLVATFFAERRRAHLMAAYEKMFGRTHVIRGASKQVGKWIGSLERHISARRMIEVGVHEWRRGIYGRVGRKSSSEWKALAVQRVLRVHGVSVPHDEAEAICIAEWGLTSDEVRKRVPKRAP